ncbi:MAG: low specificity L-threonine aldolase [Devosia sp.]|nr:low specificity L-threonine aldolase [Devosia sp.]
MNFASDNWSGATDAVMAAMARHKDGFAPAYGGDEATAAVTRTFCEVFETGVAVYFAGSGTAANALSMAAGARPGGLIFCSANAHLYHDEMGASEFFTGGMKLIPLPAQNGLIGPETLADGLARFSDDNRTGVPTILSLTQASELGTVYGVEQIRALSGIARARGMAVHMDGARFANAVAALGATPAEITWKAGIDIVSFGGTKNGCWTADAIVVFAPERFGDIGALRQRAGHTMSKARFVAAQFEGYFEDGNWITTARHANAMARRLAAGIRSSATARLGWEPQANEVFAVLPKTVISALRAAGAMFHEWPAEGVEAGPEEDLVRLVTSFATRADEVERFVGHL